MEVISSESPRRAVIPKDGKSFKDFLAAPAVGREVASATASDMITMHTSPDEEIATTNTKGKHLNYFIETYGCQMNVADSEIVHSVLQSKGYVECAGVAEADVILTNTCAIRENAESKIWNRIAFFNSMKTKNRLNKTNIGV